MPGQLSLIPYLPLSPPCSDADLYISPLIFHLFISVQCSQVTLYAMIGLLRWKKAQLAKWEVIRCCFFSVKKKQSCGLQRSGRQCPLPLQGVKVIWYCTFLIARPWANLFWVTNPMNLNRWEIHPRRMCYLLTHLWIDTLKDGFLVTQNVHRCSPLPVFLFLHTVALQQIGTTFHKSNLVYQLKYNRTINLRASHLH